MQQPGEDQHKELNQLGTALKLAWWRYGRPLGCLGMLLVAVVLITGNRNEGWWHQLPHRWTTVIGWTCLILFWMCFYAAVRSRPKQPCRFCGAPFNKVTIVGSERVGSYDQVMLRCEVCGRQWLWEGSAT